MNTIVKYLYRDASNYKELNEFIVEGEATSSDILLIKACLDDDGLFIPEQVGLPIIRPDDIITEDDHCYCELNVDDISLTDKNATISVTWNEIMEAFTDVKENGWKDDEYAV